MLVDTAHKINNACMHEASKGTSLITLVWCTRVVITCISVPQDHINAALLSDTCGNRLTIVHACLTISVMQKEILIQAQSKLR